MNIKLADRFRPFSHTPGTVCLLPGTSIEIQAFPTLLRFRDVSQKDPKTLAEHPLDVEGPVGDFTVQQDLERGVVNVWGQAQNGYIRFVISPLDRGVVLSFRGGLEVVLNFNQVVLRGDLTTERLSLGSQKQQDFECIVRRSALVEIFPLWFLLGQSLPKVSAPIVPRECLANLFQAHFVGMLSPRLTDDRYQGIQLPALDWGGNPLSILAGGSAAIRSQFIEVEGGCVKLLPHLFKEFHCGRFINVSLGDWGTIDFEWSKKLIRRAIIRPIKSGTLKLDLQKQIKSCRLRKGPKDSGEVLKTPIKLELNSGQTLYLDHFQK